ncbi:methyltransferase [Caldovatus sediminis]|uniref:Methyltransferase n=1 Tax=Caldovatus sediminis TaxID=2041189 RepID=A0A8J3EF25_9PROT|nr:SAM-dependent methyltransferase [Caldovatus sediminis]GGG49532.1 methyltransferase [Caldovatus sediminis]
MEGRPPPEGVASAWLAAEGYEAELAEELARAGRRVAAWHGRLALSPDPPGLAAWALDVWTAPRLVPAPSIKAAAAALRAIQRNWSLYAAAHHRRAALIAAALPPVKARPLVFPEPAPTAPLGAWTLLAPDLVLASPSKTSPFVNGEVRFVEDRTGPPSRAYLKLWEALTRLGRRPLPGETCLDLGAAPGGWSWALAKLGARVVAVDKAPLDPAVAALPGVTVRTESAFALDPRREPPVDWLFSDVVCYPARLLGLVRRWIAAGKARHLVCTVKFQGPTDHAVAAEFAAIPGAVLFHGAHNRHELTFARLAPG